MEIFVITAPGLEDTLAQESREKGFKVSKVIPGGVTLKGDWPEVWRSNLQLRGANRILVRLGEFPALHLSQLDKRARTFGWADTIPGGAEVSVSVTCRKSKIYHAGAARERIEGALQFSGYRISDTAAFKIYIRIESNLVLVSLDTSGEMLHRRGHKQAVNKAPMRETMASMFLRMAGYNGKEPLYDPMCGSGTFPIEAAEIACRLDPGRARGFAFQQLASFDAEAFAKMGSPQRPAAHPIIGSDRDAGAITMSQQNAERASVDHATSFEVASVGEISPPTKEPGLVIVNPPYGTRIGNKKPLYALYGSFGETMLARFRGWRVAVVTTDKQLAEATGLPWKTTGPVVAHGGLKVRLWQTGRL